MADQEESDSKAAGGLPLQLSTDDETLNASQQEPSTNLAAKEGSLRRSQRVRKLTEKSQALHEEKVNKLQAQFKASYNEWKAAAKQVKEALKEPVSARLHDHILQIQYTSAEVKQVYDKLRGHVTPDGDIRRRVDT